MSAPSHPPTVVPISAFKDNYIWALRRDRSVVVVDPGEARPVLDYIDREGVALTGILVTHHHNDHVGGIGELLERWKVPVHGPRGEPIPTLTHPVGGGDAVAVPGLGVTFDVIDIPGHTRAHIAYYGNYYGAKVLFCGDTLFACGCGRIFEGTPEQMYASLERLAALPDETLVYCGHEYTLSNIGFAKAVEPANAALADRERVEASTRAAGRPTLPTTIGRERATNPFLRCAQPAVAEAADKYLGSHVSTPAQVFAAIRAWKNSF